MSIFSMVGIAALYVFALCVCAYFVAEAYQTKLADVITGVAIPVMMLLCFLAFIIVGDVTWKNLFLIGIVISIPTSITYICVRLKGDSGMSSILFLIFTAIIIALLCIFTINTEYVVQKQDRFEVIAINNTVSVTGSYASTDKEYMVFVKEKSNNGEEIAKLFIIPVAKTTIYIVDDNQEEEYLVIKLIDTISSDKIRNNKVKWRGETFYNYELYIKKETLRSEMVYHIE